MALAPVQQISTPFEDFPSYWLKGYAQGTLNAISMATDSTGGTLIARAEISAGGTVPIGFIKTAGDAIFIPYYSEAYDLYLFPTAAEADADDTANAVQVADNMAFLQDFANQVGIERAFKTVAAMVADTDIAIGNLISVADRASSRDSGGNNYEAVTEGSGVDDGGSFIDLPNTTPPLQAKALFPQGIHKPQQWGALGSGDDFTAINNAQIYVASVGGSLDFSGVDHSISDVINLTSNITINMDSSASITQTTIDKGVFWANAQDRVWINARRGQLVGEGTWSAGWTGNSGHDDRVVQFTNCTRSGISGVVIKNGANAGISIVAGDQISIIDNIIEGTNTVPASGNFQNGMYIKHDSVEGGITNLNILGNDVSLTAQGILVEGFNGYTSVGSISTNINNNIIHDIPGQHGIYCQVGKVNINGNNIDNCNLDGIKVQDNSAVNPNDVNIIGFNISNCGSAAVELQASALNGGVDGVMLQGVARNCQRGLSINDHVTNVKADIICENTTRQGFILQRQNTGGSAGLPSDIDVTINSTGSGEEGVIIFADECVGIDIRPTVKQANTSAGAFDGIQVASTVGGNSDITFHCPDVTDSGGNMRYGFFIDSTLAQVSIKESARFTGAATAPLRADIDLLEFPTDYTIDTTSGALPTPPAITTSVHPNIATILTTSASNTTLWQRAMPDESAFWLTAEISGKLSDSSERRGITTSRLVYRDAGGVATFEGAEVVHGDVASAGFAGVYTWEVSGNNIRIRVNSGGVANYDWKARLTVEDLS